MTASNLTRWERTKADPVKWKKYKDRQARHYENKIARQRALRLKNELPTARLNNRKSNLVSDRESVEIDIARGQLSNSGLMIKHGISYDKLMEIKNLGV